MIVAAREKEATIASGVGWSSRPSACVVYQAPKARVRAEIAVGETILAVGDQVLAILEPDREDEVRQLLLGR